LEESSPSVFSYNSSDDEEESNNGIDDKSNLVVMTAWGKSFYFVDVFPKAEAPAKEKSTPAALAMMPQQQQQNTLYSHRPLPPAPRIFISDSPPLAPSVALEFDGLALDFFHLQDIITRNAINRVTTTTNSIGNLGRTSCDVPLRSFRGNSLESK
jgi:hypothetical protein